MQTNSPNFITVIKTFYVMKTDLSLYAVPLCPLGFRGMVVLVLGSGADRG